MRDEQEQNLKGDIEEGSLFTFFMSRRQKKYNKKKAFSNYTLYIPG